MARLVISIDLGPDETACCNAMDYLHSLQQSLPADAQITVTRDNDRSGANLLLPKVEGRFGSHYQNRKASLDEIIKKQE